MHQETFNHDYDTGGKHPVDWIFLTKHLTLGNVDMSHTVNIIIIVVVVSSSINSISSIIGWFCCCYCSLLIHKKREIFPPPNVFSECKSYSPLRSVAQSRWLAGCCLPKEEFSGMDVPAVWTLCKAPQPLLNGWRL